MQLTDVIAERRLAAAVHELRRAQARDRGRRHAGGARRISRIPIARSGMFIPEAAPDRTTVPARPTIDVAADHLQAGHQRGRRRSARSGSGQHREAHPALDRCRADYDWRCCPKGTRGNRVQASLTLRFGDETVARRQERGGATGGSALLMRGTKTKSRQQMQDEMQKLNATINVGGGLASVSAQHLDHRREPGSCHAARCRDPARARVSRVRLRSDSQAADRADSSAAAPNRARWSPRRCRAT